MLQNLLGGKDVVPMIREMNKPKITEIFLTAEQIAERYQVHVSTVCAWIAAMELTAVCVSKSRNGTRHRWRVHPEALEDFERRRTRLAAPPRLRRRWRPDYERIV